MVIKEKKTFPLDIKAKVLAMKSLHRYRFISYYSKDFPLFSFLIQLMLKKNYQVLAISNLELITRA